MTKALIIIILLAGASLLTIFYVRPQWNAFSLARKEVEGLYKISTELDEIIAKRDSLIESINAIPEEDKDRIDSAVPQGPHAADFLVMLEQLILRHKLTLKRVEVTSLTNAPKTAKQTAGTPAAAQPGAPKPGSVVLAPKPKIAVAEFPVSLTITGTYESFKEFLHDIESLLRITTITDISFTSADKTALFDFTVRGKAYYQ